MTLHISGDNIARYATWLGYLGIAVCVFTWALELMELVYRCPYCQVQRTAIGILGVLLVIGRRNIVTLYITLGVGFFGAHVAATQVFNNFYKGAFGSIFIYLASCALAILIAQMLVMFLLPKQRAS